MKKLFTLFAAVACATSMWAQITVAVDNTSTYKPTQIINGSFDTEPWMVFTYNNVTYNSCPNNPSFDSGGNKYASNVVFHGVNEGWNTTELSWWRGTLFEYTDGSSTHNCQHNSTIPMSDKYVEMNCYHATMLYQDLTTHGRDVIRWTLKHGITPGGNEEQPMHVEIGAPNRDSNGNIINASGWASSLNPQIDVNTAAYFRYDGVQDNNNNASTCGFGSATDLQYLRLTKTDHSNGWRTAQGVYIIPDGQTVTRFGFVSEAAQPNVGNLLDDITFSTLIGNLSAQQVGNDDVLLRGYWGEKTASKTLKVIIGSTTHSINMSSVTGKNFVVTIPAATIGSATSVTVYHEDYYAARLEISVTPTYSIEMAEGIEDLSNWTLSTDRAEAGQTITVDYTGSKNIESIEIGNTHTYYVNDASELATQLANFNANPGSRLVLNTNVSTMTITAEEGVIDLNGHTVTSNSSFLLQNNTLGKAITIKNGTIIGMDGAIGWGDVYKGTVILENIYVVNDLYTDGHAYILRNGTYKNVQNFTKNDAPGTVTVYSGVKIKNRNSVSPSGGTHAGTFIDLAEPAPDITGVTEVVHNAQWTFSMPAHDADVFVTYADFEGSGTENDPYLIPDLAAWNTLAGKVNTGMTYDDKFFRQTGDISGVTAFMGIFVDNQLYNQKPFMGTYDGDGHTLNVNLNASVGFLAPIRCVYDAIIKNMVVTGSVTASSRHASGLVGTLAGPCTIENCLVSTNVSGTDYMGGVIGHSRYDGFTITGTVYNGTLTPTGGNYTGGFNGWGGEAVTPYATITDCFFAGTYINSSGGKFHPVGCFGGANATRTISNVYYTTSPINMTNETNVSVVKNPVTYKGERVYSVTAGTGVTVTPVGTPVTSYNVSKLDLYGEDGIAFNGIRYGAQGDVISMNLTGGDNYTATTGTLTGSANPYTLTMAAANSEINFVPVASVTTSGNVTTNYGTFANALAAWENSSTLTLLANVTHNQTINISNTRTLDLNGFGIKRTGTGRVIRMYNGGNLTINDSNPDAEHKFTVTNAYGDAGLGVVNDALTEGYQTFHGGYITGGNGVGEGGCIYAQSVNSVVTINGGVFIGNRSNTHGGFYWGHTNPTLNMNGGRIIYNLTACQGAAVFIGNANMRLYGGEISHNYSTGGGRAHSGGICSAGNNNFYMHGAPIVTANIGGNSNVTNQPNDICLESMMRVDGEMTNTTPIGIMMNIGGWDGKQRGQFSYDSEYIDNSTPSHFVGQNYGNDEVVRIGDALWLWNPTRDTHGTVAYQVTYDPRGGSAVTGQTVLKGEKASQPENPIKAGLSFVGWYKDVLFSETWDFATEVVNADITLYARYSNDAALTTAPTAISGLIYAGAAQALVSAGAADGGTMRYKLGDGDWSADIPTAIIPGNYTVYYMVKGDATHEDLVPASNELHISIDPAPLTIEAEDKQTVYGAAAPAYTATITGFVLGEDESVLGGALDFSCAYTVGADLGNYTITPSGLSSDNYQLFYQNGILAVSAPTSVTFADNEDNTVVMEALYGETLDITIGRTIKAGIYNTFCLPFNLSASEIAASPLAGATLKNYDGADVTGTGAERDLNIYLSDLTDIVAGKPFLIKTETEIVNPTFTDVTIAYDELMGQNIVADHVDFQGILAPYDLAAYSNSSPDFLGVGNDGRLYWADASKSTGPMRGFRAFFHVKDAGSSNNAPVRRGMHAQFVESAPQVATGVNQITNDQSQMTDKVIKDGVLYILRGDKTFTITGQEVK